MILEKKEKRFGNLKSEDRTAAKHERIGGTQKHLGRAQLLSLGSYRMKEADASSKR